MMMGTYEVLIAVLLKIRIFWDVMLCLWECSSCCFEGLLHLHIHVKMVHGGHFDLGAFRLLGLKM